MTHRSLVTYQLGIKLDHALELQIGRLGRFDFPAGYYVYTGSAKRNIEARIARHLSRDKKMHWHIDWLLAADGVAILGVRRSTRAECLLNRATGGRVVVPGFGASDCHAGCGSHLRYLGTSPGPGHPARPAALFKPATDPCHDD